MKVVFVNYGRFDCNSGGHIARFAAGLAARGRSVGVFAEGDPAGAGAFGGSGFAALPRRALHENPERALAFDGRAAGDDLVIHAWTPREAVRGVVQRLRRHAPPGHRLVVHLEDDETLLTAAQLGRPWTELASLPAAELEGLVRPSLSHPLRMAPFLAEADGITAIVPTLFALAPAGAPRHLLQPGADLAETGPPLSHRRRAELLERLGVPIWHRILVYPGNLHPANRREMFSLYVAVHVLRRRGWGVTLLRTGDDYAPGLDTAFDHLRGQVSRELGRLPRQDMLALLKLADVLVQPGAPDIFNQRRLPSKLPEFLATGIPVVLPRANLGLRLVDGREAVVLDEGHGLEIAERVEGLFREPERAAAIGAAGRAFALRHLDWDRAAAALDGFYTTLMQRPAHAVRPAQARAA